MKRMVVFGYGYSGRAIGAALLAEGWRVTGTSRTEAGCAALAASGANACVFDGAAPTTDLATAIAQATHGLISIPPDDAGDPVLRVYREALLESQQLEWLGYLSTVGVYGDHGGARVDEATAPKPKSARSHRRLAAEQAWQDFAVAIGVPLQIFRLAGIYGPGRSAIDKLRAGTARRLIKPGQVFNRIHVADISGAVLAGIAHPDRIGIVNVTDDAPGPPQDVITYGAELLDIPPPPKQDFATADLSVMARSFYGENKRVSNDRLKTDLGYRLRYPTYREGLRAIRTNR